MFFDRGMIMYIDGDWEGAFIAWELAHELNKKDGPLNLLFERVKKVNHCAPETWEKAWDWDVRPEPPE